MALRNAPSGDNTFTLFGDQKQNILDIPIRIIRVTLDNGTEEYLATNITDTKITQSMFKELYFLVKVKSFAPRQIQRRLFAALVTLSRKVF